MTMEEPPLSVGGEDGCGGTAEPHAAGGASEKAAAIARSTGAAAGDTEWGLAPATNNGLAQGFGASGEWR
jgi:hypothetical protein